MPNPWRITLEEAVAAAERLKTREDAADARAAPLFHKMAREEAIHEDAPEGDGSEAKAPED